MLAVKHQPDRVRFQMSPDDPNAQQTETSKKDANFGRVDKRDIGDAAPLERLLDHLMRMNTEKTQHFIARWVTYVFVVWTLVGLLEHFTTGNCSLLLSDAGPGTLFSIVVHRYLGNSEKKNETKSIKRTEF